jgi:hypothetical protein
MKGVDVTVSEPAGAVWRKSSRSGAGNDCVELIVGRSGAKVRDSKHRDGRQLVFADTRWHAFLGVIKEEGRRQSR